MTSQQWYDIAVIVIHLNIRDIKNLDKKYSKEYANVYWPGDNIEVVTP